jgi:hypothetical protein
VSGGPITLRDIRSKHPDISDDDFHSAAWHLMNTHKVDLDKQWKLCKVA